MKKIIKKIVLVLFIFAFLILEALAAGKLQKQISMGLLKPATLRAISNLPKGDPNNLQKITSMFLYDMGYPKDLIKVQFFKSGISGYQGDITGGYFKLASGEIFLNPMLAKANPGAAASIIRHELDHFQKAAQLCKSIGIQNYSKIFGADNINTAFWQKAMNYTKVPPNFDTQKYLAGIQKFAIAADMTSPYHIYSARTDGRRNILEITAYDLSDAVYEYYKIPNNQTSLEKVANAFNSVDIKINNLSKKYPVLNNEKTGIFDYFYAKTIIQNDPSMKTVFQKSARSNNMNAFWDADKQQRNSFYASEKVDPQTVSQIVQLLNSMAANIPNSLTIKQTRDILELKYTTLKSALKKTDSDKFSILLNLNMTTNDYMKFLETYTINDDGTKLKLYITKSQLVGQSFKLPNGEIKTIGKKGDLEKIAKEIFKNAEFQRICKGQDKNKCIINIINANKLL